MPEKILRNIRAATVSASNAFAEVEATLSLSIESRFVYMVSAVRVVVDTVTALDTACNFQWQICRESQSAIVTYADPAAIWKGHRQTALTTSGGVALPFEWNYDLTMPYAIAASTLFFGVKTTGAAADTIFSMNLSYYPAKVTDRQFWEASTSR